MPDRAALVTGASSGIGLAIADVLGAEGYGMTVAARRPEKLAAAIEELRGKGYDVEEVAANLTAEEDIQRVVAARLRDPRDRLPAARGSDLRPMSAIKRSHVRSQSQYI
jgi:NAD(P)-dependent dehydrogenase (short-subunit alcohol dehydrogenase family)